MPKKGSLRKRTRQAVEAEQEIIEDLDLDVEDHTVVDDDVVHNRRRKSRGTNGIDRDDDDMYDEQLAAVLPSDAHKLEGYDDDDDERGAHLEEENLARAANKTMRRQVIDSDFDVGGISASAKPARLRDGGGDNDIDVSNMAPAMEAVERDYAALTSSERLAMMQKESPEMIKMFEDMKQYIAEVQELAKPLQELLFQRRVSDADRNLVMFLETKVQLMLSYCMHATYYLLLKAEGKKVAGHPVIDTLIEIRVYLEKLFPLEEKLQYSLNRLLSGRPAATAHLDALRPLRQGERGALAANGSGSRGGGGEARKTRKDLEALREAEAIEREELSTMHRMQTKKASAAAAAGAVDRTAATSALGYHEDEDQYFAKIAADEDEDDDDEEDGDDDHEGLSLIERLRRRQRAVAAVSAKPNAQSAQNEESDADFEEDEDEADLLSDGTEGEEGEYETLLAEENERRRKKAAAESTPRPKFVEPEFDRRKAGKRIEAHRGLTRPRPKDRKTPRTAQRRKYEKGMRIHKAQSRTVVPEAEGGFIGVQAIKSRVTQSTRL